MKLKLRVTFTSPALNSLASPLGFQRGPSVFVTDVLWLTRLPHTYYCLSHKYTMATHRKRWSFTVRLENT